MKHAFYMCSVCVDNMLLWCFLWMTCNSVSLLGLCALTVTASTLLRPWIWSEYSTVQKRTDRICAWVILCWYWILVDGLYALPQSDTVCFIHNAVGSRFMTVHFYDPRRVGSGTPDLWCVTVPTQSILSLLSALLALCRCACASSVQFFRVDCDISTHDVHQKDKKEEKIRTVYVTFFLDVFWTTTWAFNNRVKSNLTEFFFQLSV